MNVAAADTLMAIFGLHRGDTMKIKDCMRNSWVRLASDLSLLRYYDMSGGSARCQRLDGKMIVVDPDTDVQQLQPLGYDDGEC